MFELSMIIIAIVLLLVTAMIGISLLIKILSKERISRNSISAHGTLAICALLLVIGGFYSSFSEFWLFIQSKQGIDVLLLCLTAITGLALFKTKHNSILLRRLLMLLHPILAIITIVSLVVSILPSH